MTMQPYQSKAPSRQAILRTFMLVTASLGFLPALAQQTPYFTSGNLVVVVEGCGAFASTCTAVPNGTGNGTGNSSTGGYGDNQGAPLTLFQFAPVGTTSAQYVNSLVLPQATSGANFPVSGEYGSSSEGTLQLSGTGQYLTVMGYGINAATFNANPTAYGAAPSLALAQSGSLTNQSYTPIPRVVVLVDQDGNVNSSTAIYNVFNTNNPRSVYTPNGAVAYISGQGSGSDATGGVFYTPLNIINSSPLAITGLDTTSNTLSQDTRTVQGYNNQLLVSVDSKGGSGSARDYIGTLGSAGILPTSTVGAPVMLNGFGNSGGTGKETITTGANSNGNNLNAGLAINISSSNYFFASPSVLYVADTGNPKNNSNTSTVGNGGLEKWINSNADGSGSWSLAYTLYRGLNLVLNTSAAGTTGLYGLAGTVSAGTVQLYATNATIGDLDPTFLYGITDTLSDTTASQASSESFTQLAAAPQDSNFKGVSLAPTVAAPVNPITMGTGFTPGSVDLNGSAILNGGSLQLTTVGNTNQAASAFAPAPVNAQAFTNDFTFQVTSPGADGFMFVLQNMGPNALGGYGGNLGFAAGYGAPAVTPSVGIKFDLYSNAGEGSDSTGLYISGASPTTPATDLTSTGIDLHSGHPFQVHMSYNGTVLVVTITDTVTQTQATQSYTVNIPAALGGNTAYAGFTAGTGGETATQTILTWTYAPGVPVNAPVLPAAGSFAAPQTITITDPTPGAAVYYTLNGSIPTPRSTLYSGPFVLNVTAPVNAIAVLNSVASQISSTTYTISGATIPVSTPTITSAAVGTTNTYTATISDVTPGAAIFYTVDGSAPTAASTLYTGPIPVFYSQTIRAVAVLSGTTSSTGTKAFTVTPADHVGFVVVAYNGPFYFNGSAYATDTPNYTQSQLLLTDTSGGNEAGSVFANSVLGVQAFTTDFYFEVEFRELIDLEFESADGLMFVIQNQGPQALGSYGEYLGYGSQSSPITKSVGIKFDFYNNAGEGDSSTGLYLNGATPTVPSIDLIPSGIHLVTGSYIHVSITYAGTTLTVTITDTNTNASATQTYTNVNIPAIVGANTAFVGFTGGTGGLRSNQVLGAWNFTATQP